MNKYTLFIGAILTVISGIMYELESFAAGGIVLLWIAISLIKK